MKQKYLHKRGDFFQYRRSVAPRLRPIVGQTEWVKSLRTSDSSEAAIVFANFHRKIEALIKSCEGGMLHDFSDIERLKKLARDLGLTTVDTSAIQSAHVDVATLTSALEAVVRNVIISMDWHAPTRTQVSALASTVRTMVTFREVAEWYEEHTRDRWTSKHTSRDREKYYKPIYAAISDFEIVIPNANFLSLTRKDVQKFRGYMISKVEAGEIKPHTVNKKFMNLRKMTSAYLKDELADLDKANPFDGVKLKDTRKGKRPPFTAIEMASVKIHLGTSASNDELLAINFIGMETGATCKELCLLTQSDIHLTGEIPYIRIAENEFRDQVKSGGARHRDVPLLNDALKWAKRFPDGFPRYRRTNGSEAVSAASNKLLAAVTDKTFYSYRHTMADKLRNSGCSDSLKDAILGHTTPGMGAHYGEGFSLAMKRDALTLALAL
ncbi:hypothetical protein IHQ71_00295 [Rhizobium sp. TH2]|uniref:DUF6538 domain-containing protein n=1 Tax=Rhizobium sp. TH2 TaxID=2775403 RepID=UPI00215899D0|nr:DUF6538 domain-containing protein [Rhizobium sp. TH2]UVC09115.1 hypothetical protein IHQ71_00295 [Rhizobium sp. TH2]